MMTARRETAGPPSESRQSERAGRRAERRGGQKPGARQRRVRQSIKRRLAAFAHALLRALTRVGMVQTDGELMTRIRFAAMDEESLPLFLRGQSSSGTPPAPAAGPSETAPRGAAGRPSRGEVVPGGRLDAARRAADDAPGAPRLVEGKAGGASRGSVGAWPVNRSAGRE